MAEEITKTVDNPNQSTVTAPTFDRPVSIPNNPVATVQDLTAADPRHKDYDPLKSTRVKEYTDGLFSKMAQKDKDVEGLKTMVETLKGNLSSFEKEKKKKEDAEKSELQRATDQLADLQNNVSRLEGQMTESKDSHTKEKISLNAKYSIMNEVAKAGIKINSAEQRGLIDELEEKLSKMSEKDDPEEIATNIVVEFRKERDKNFVPPNAPNPPVVTTVEPTSITNIEKQMKELSKGTITAEDEAKLKELSAELERKRFG